MAKLRDGKAPELTLNKNKKTLSQTKYGTFQIKLSDLKKLVLRTVVPG